MFIFKVINMQSNTRNFRNGVGRFHEFALIYGIMIGDGCISRSGKKYFISICGNIKDDPMFFERVIIPKLSKIRGKEIRYRRREKYGKIEINFSDKSLFTKFRTYGFPVGHKRNISIPRKFLMNKVFIKKVIAGIFATDGSIPLVRNNGILYPRLEFRSISRKLLKQIQVVLFEAGMKGGLYKKFYRLQYNGIKQLLLFKKRIGFVNPKHSERVSQFLKMNARGGYRTLGLQIS